MVIRTYFDKNNTLISNSSVNTGLNPVTELFYGGPINSSRYSRFIFKFDETRIKALINDGTFGDTTKLKHTLRMTNTGSFDKDLLNTNMGSKRRTSSFDLILFEVNQDWDGGVGYDYEKPLLTQGDFGYSTYPSNWVRAKTGINWANGAGVYAGAPPPAIIVDTQHFDKGNENIEMDITAYVNKLLSGAVNYGLGIAYDRSYELLNSPEYQYVGFFTNNTQTFYEPYIETVYDNYIKDDRNDFYTDKNNKLYLYVNLAGEPTNLDNIPKVDVYTNNNVLFKSFQPNNVEHVTKGVYAIDLNVPSSFGDCVMFNDVWRNITINGINRPDISLDFILKDSMSFFNIGDNSFLPKKTTISVSGIQSREKIKRGDIKKVIISARIPYTVEQSQLIDDIKYRLYVTEGSAELTVIDFHPIEKTNTHYYFLLDTQSLIPNTYYLDVLVTSNLETTTLKNVLQFEIINQVELRKGQ
jgi:hypothetical protein